VGFIGVRLGFENGEVERVEEGEGDGDGEKGWNGNVLVYTTSLMSAPLLITMMIMIGPSVHRYPQRQLTHSRIPILVPTGLILALRDLRSTQL